MRKGNDSVRGVRRPVCLGAELDKFLSTYAVAASAAGVSLLALTAAAEAKIVYTPANTPITLNAGRVPIDLNNDGTADFYLSLWSVSNTGGVKHLLASGANQSNQIWGGGGFSHGGILHGAGGRANPLKRSYGGFFVSALRAGITVGPNKSYFQKGPGSMAFARWSDGFGGTATGGQWWCTQPRYLGLKFVINGKTHYGWAREQDKTSSGFTLTGYAYETIPNKPIVTGKTKGSDAIAKEDASLGCLAKGASAIPSWRLNPQPDGAR